MENFPHLPTLLSVAAAAVLLIFILNRWLFRPLNAILDRRRDEVAEARAAFEEAQRVQEERIDAVEAKLAAARKEAYAIREQAQQDGRQRREELLAEARAEAMERIAEAKAEIESEVEVAKRKLEDEARALSAQIAERLLGRPVGPGGDEP